MTRTFDLAGNRALLPFAAVVLGEVLFLLVARNARLEEPSSILAAFALGAPFVAIGVLLSPGALLAVAPALILFPRIFLGFVAFEWLLLAALFGAALRAGASGRLAERPAAIELLFLLYVAWALLAIGQAVEVRPALEGAKRIAVFLLAFLAGRRVLGAAGARGILRVLAFLAILIAGQLVVVVLARGYSFTLLTTHLGKLTDMGWGRSNYIAATAALAASAALALVVFGRGWERLLGALGISAAAFVAFATVSRGGAIALLAGILLAIALGGRKRLLSTGLLAGAAAGAYLVSPFGRALGLRFLHPEELPSVGVRFLFFRESFEVARSHWLLGAGPDQIPYHSAFDVDKNPHNIFLKNAADLGLPGLLLYIALLVLAARAAGRYRGAAGADRDERLHAVALTLALGVAVVNACYEPTLEGAEYGFLFWLLIGALTARAEAASLRAPETA